MNKKLIPGLALISLLSSLWGGELEDYRLIRNAYQDQLYLFVEDKARAFLAKDDYRLKVDEVRSYLIAGFLEREAYAKALEELGALGKDVEGPRWTYLKARALFGAMVEQGVPFPEGERRPWELLKEALPSLRGEEKLMARYVMGQDLFEVGDYRQASLTLKPLVEGDKRFRYKEDAKFLYGRALFYLPIPLYEDALYTFRELSQKYVNSPLLPRYHFWQAQCYFELNQLDKAETAFGGALGANPDPTTVVDVNYNLGWLYGAMGDLERASSSLKAVLDAPKEHAERYLPSARYKMGSILMLQKEPARCVEVLKSVLDDPELKFEASLLAAQASVNLDDLKGASSFLDVARRSPQKEIRLQAERMMGRIQLEQGDFDAAEQTLKSLVDKEVPLDYRIEVELQLADVYFAKGDLYRSQEIYQQLLAEKNKKIEAALHYNLARCAMRANPLLEGIFQRDRLLEDKAELPSEEFDARKMSIESKVQAELGKYWVLASDLGEPKRVANLEKRRIFSELSTFASLNRSDLIAKMKERAKAYSRGEDDPLWNLSDPFQLGLTDFGTLARAVRKDTVLSQLEKMTGKNRKEMITDLKQKALEDGIEIPPPIGMDTVMYKRLVEAFKAQLWEDGKVASYNDLPSSLGILARNSKDLQITAIKAHLDHVINMGQKNPYLALAHFEKAMLFKQQGLLGDAIESLQRAVANATNLKLRADYLLEISRIEIDMARSMSEPGEGEGAPSTDTKSMSFKLNRALKHLEKAEEILGGRPLKLADLLFSAHRLLLNNDRAEAVLVKFLESAEDINEIQSVEERLISFYLQRKRPVMAAQRRLVYAESLSAHGLAIEAQKQSFKAAVTLLESKEGHEDGVARLVELSKAKPGSEWTFRAGLQRVSILQRAQEAEQAEGLLEFLEKSSSTQPLALQLEAQMAKGDHAMNLGDLPKAAEAFSQVIERAGKQEDLKARAMIEYSKTLKRSEPGKAADVLLEFYYLFPRHTKREEALYESCRLQIVSLKGKDLSDEARKARKAEILRLINKLGQARDRQKLSAYLQGV